MEKHTEHKLLHKAIDRISYRHRHEQALSSFKEKKRRYLSMNEDEFLLSYIETVSYTHLTLPTICSV